MKPLKSFIRNTIAGVLAAFARGIVRKYKPTVVMVTGSVGKTSTKDAVAAALSENFFVRKSEKSYNSEFGVPLTIIGVDNPWANPFAWLAVFRKAFLVRFFSTKYPKLLVLEVGADHPGDLAKILKITKPDAVVVTLLPSVPVHVEAYENPAAVREEEFAPVLALSPGAPLIICADDDFAIAKTQRIETQAYYYGVSPHSDVRIGNVGLWMEEEGTSLGAIKGMQATLTISGKEYALKVPGVLGRSQLFAPAAAVATACTLGMSPLESLKGLASYVPPPGRGRIFKGKKDTLLIDDTYNSSPAAVEEILRSLELIPRSTRKLVVLGDMLELGRYSAAEHRRIGHISKEVADILVTVGPRAKAIGEAAQEDGMSEDVIFHFDTSIEAAVPVEELLHEGDVVLLKASQSVRMERIVRPLLENFADVSQLVRQDAEWLKR